MGYTVTENGSAFDRGVAAGEIAQRLKEHDKHFAQINGSMERVADELSGIKLQMQRMADAMSADRATVLTTAAAVEKERESTAQAVEKERTTLRDQAETRWSPLMRWGVFAGILAAIASVVAIVLANVIH
jgi:hypothetical protein